MIIIYHSERNNNNWLHGTITDTVNDIDCTYEAMVFDEPSDYGIKTSHYPNGNNVSKLCVRDTQNDEIISYDREWYVKPSEQFSNAFDSLMEDLETIVN